MTFSSLKKVAVGLMAVTVALAAAFAASGMPEAAAMHALLAVVAILLYIVIDLKQRVVSLEETRRQEAMQRHPAKGDQS